MAENHQLDGFIKTDAKIESEREVIRKYVFAKASAMKKLIAIALHELELEFNFKWKLVSESALQYQSFHMRAPDMCYGTPAALMGWKIFVTQRCDVIRSPSVRQFTIEKEFDQEEVVGLIFKFALNDQDLTEGLAK